MSFSTLENKLDKLSILVGADSEKEENTFIERQRLTIRWWNKAIDTSIFAFHSLLNFNIPRTFRGTLRPHPHPPQGAVMDPLMTYAVSRPLTNTGRPL